MPLREVLAITVCIPIGTIENTIWDIQLGYIGSLYGGLMFKVQSKQCATCIYRKDSTLDIAELEKQVADPHMEGFFKGHRVCHHSNDVCCRGFWNRHKDQFQAGQLAQRLDFVEFVDVDKLNPI